MPELGLGPEPEGLGARLADLRFLAGPLWRGRRRNRRPDVRRGGRLGGDCRKVEIDRLGRAHRRRPALEALGDPAQFADDGRKPDQEETAADRGRAGHDEGGAKRQFIEGKAESGRSEARAGNHNTQ